jgi:tetratricopeptide (TPR) repeat protein
MNFRFLYLALLSFCLLGACKNDKKPAPISAVQEAQMMDPDLNAVTAQLEKDPQNDSLLYRRAQLLLKNKVFDLALNDVGEALRIDSMRPAYYHLMADILMDFARPNDSKKAIDVLSAAARKFPTRIPTLLKLSELQLIVRQHAMSLYTIDRVLQQDPQNADAFYLAGRVALDKRDTINAIKSLQKSTQLDAYNADAWLMLGRIFLANNKPQAVQYFDNAFRVDTTNVEALELKGAFFKKKGEFDKAFAVYRDIIRRNPDYSNAFFDMGTIYLELDSLQKAYDHFDMAAKTDALFVKAWYYRGVSSELMGNKEAALADYTKANKMSPNWKDALEARERLEKK